MDLDLRGSHPGRRDQDRGGVFYFRDVVTLCIFRLSVIRVCEIRAGLCCPGTPLYEVVSAFA